MSICEPGSFIVGLTFYAESSIVSEPMTPMSRASGELIPMPNKPTTDKVDTPKAAPATAKSSTPTPATASSSTAIAPTPVRNPLLVSFFFDTIQRLFKVPTSVDLTYNGFEVTFSTKSIAWADVPSADATDTAAAADDRRVFEIMSAPANAALHRYIKDLAHVRAESAALQESEEGPNKPVKTLEQRVKEEQETVMSWMKRVCEAAGGLGIGDTAFSPRK
jgi:hypothetical protein